MEISDDTHAVEGVKEVIAAARNPERGPDAWEFSEIEVSAFWKFALTEAWAIRVQDEYYEEFWTEMMDAIKDEAGPLQIEITCLYYVGRESQETIKAYMPRWVEFKTGIIHVKLEDETDRNPQFVYMHMESFKVEPLKANV